MIQPHGMTTYSYSWSKDTISVSKVGNDLSFIECNPLFNIITKTFETKFSIISESSIDTKFTVGISVSSTTTLVFIRDLRTRTNKKSGQTSA